MTPLTPKPETLAKYGLSLEEWRAILESQGGVCPICGKIPPSGRMVVDHEHVPKWKTMKPELRKTFVRGILCWWDNKNCVGRSVTLAKARNAVRYLEAYEKQVHGDDVGDITILGS